MYSESLFSTLYIEIKRMLKRNSFAQNKCCRKWTLFLRAPPPHRFTFKSQFLYELKNRIHLFNSVWGIFHFLFRFVYIKLYFCSIKIKMDSLTLKRYNFFQNQNNRKAKHSFAPRPLIFKLQQEVLKFNNICVCWNSPKTGDLSKLRKFWESQFSNF